MFWFPCSKVHLFLTDAWAECPLACTAHTASPNGGLCPHPQPPLSHPGTNATGRCLVQPLQRPPHTHPLVLQRESPCPRSPHGHLSSGDWDGDHREGVEQLCFPGPAPPQPVDSWGWFDPRSQPRGSPARVSPTPLGSHPCWASVTTDLCRAL